MTTEQNINTYSPERIVPHCAEFDDVAYFALAKRRNPKRMLFRLDETRARPSEINTQVHSFSPSLRLRKTPGRQPSYVGCPEAGLAPNISPLGPRDEAFGQGMAPCEAAYLTPHGARTPSLAKSGGPC